jgi:hypothetical protein
MLHQDGSRHAWLEGQPALDLIVTLDDATGAIYSAFLIEEEGTASTFRALKEVFGKHGLPMSLYTDRGSHYFRTTDEIDKQFLRQRAIYGERERPRGEARRVGCKRRQASYSFLAGLRRSRAWPFGGRGRQASMKCS